MAESTSHPDCVHCRYMLRNNSGEYRCHQHDMILHTPVSLFCKMIAPPDDNDADYQHWFHEKIDASALEANTLYTWVETSIRDEQGNMDMRIDPEVIAPLTAYITWSAGTFWQVLRDVRLKKRYQYRQQGYRLDESKG